MKLTLAAVPETANVFVCFRGKPYLHYFDILDCTKVGIGAIALGCPTPAVSTGIQAQSFE